MSHIENKLEINKRINSKPIYITRQISADTCKGVYIGDDLITTRAFLRMKL